MKDIIKDIITEWEGSQGFMRENDITFSRRDTQGVLVIRDRYTRYMRYHVCVYEYNRLGRHNCLEKMCNNYEIVITHNWKGTNAEITAALLRHSSVLECTAEGIITLDTAIINLKEFLEEIEEDLQ